MLVPPHALTHTPRARIVGSRAAGTIVSVAAIAPVSPDAARGAPVSSQPGDSAATPPAAAAVWTPHEGTSPFLRRPLALRWLTLHPLQRRLPLGALSAFTFGEALALAASTVFLLGSMWWLNDGAGSGKLARVPILFAFLTASKHSLFSFALGLPFERALFWHKLAAAWGVALGAWHGYIAFEADAARSGPPVLSVALGALRSYFALLADDGTLLAGGMLRAAPSGMLLSGWWVFGGYASLFLLAAPPIRRRFYELFRRLHLLVMLLAVGATLSHGGPQVLLGFGLWLLDVLFRYAFRARFRNTRRARLDCLPCDVTRVTLLHGAGAKGEGGADKLSYMPGQYVFLCVPALSPYEWHPFSLSTAPCQPEVMLHVRTLGDWTCRLRELAATADGDEVEVLVDGPYGEPSVDVAGARYKHFLIIAGGIGITPMQSFCNQLLDEAARGRPLRMLWFAWVCPERSMIQSILPGKRASRRGVPIGDARAAEAGAAGAGAHGGVLPNAFTPNLLVRLATSESLSRVAAELDESDVPGADGHAAAQTAKVNGVEPQRRPSRARKLGEPAASAGAPDILHTEFYLTRARAPIEGAAADGATPDDPYHHASLRSGRPDFCKMLGVMRALAEADGEARVAVLACGPAQMLASARAACVAHSGRGVGFDLHTEMFEF